MRKLFLIFLLPGVVFQSIIVAGGYGTGQELSVFFLSLGPITAITLMVIASLLAKIGLVKLIMIAAQTYAWFFLLMFLVPLLTVGIYRIVKTGAVQQ
jgi:uncharacterized membrane protein YkvI